MENKKIIDHGVHVIAYIKNNKKYAMTCAWSMLCDYDKILMLLGSQSVTGKNLKKGDAEAAFTNAIKKCGQLLAENFPNHEENPNELADGLVVLEDAEWY